MSRDNIALAPQFVLPAEDVGFSEADITRVLPVQPALAGLLPGPGGIRRGATVAVVDYTSLVRVLLAGAMAAGTCCGAVVGLPALGVLTTTEAGICSSAWKAASSMIPVVVRGETRPGRTRHNGQPKRVEGVCSAKVNALASLFLTA